MEKVIILYLPQVEFYIDDLIDILYKEEYFGFKEDAKLYVDKMINYIEQHISTYPAKNTPTKLLQFGEKYMLYKANNRTTWYIFFSQEEQIYFVQFVTNNHSELVANFNL